MKKVFTPIFFLLIFPHFLQGQGLTTLFEKSGGTQSPAYADIISWWQQLDKQSDYIKMMPMGMSDAGFPLHLVLVSADKDFSIPSLKKKNKRIILVMNGIHPGEPDGIDASMVLCRNISNGLYNHAAERKSGGGRTAVAKPDYLLPDNVVLAIIPVYNIGGCLNSSANYRIDQNGPEEKGFRGNSENLDLNRDFIKSDSKEARSFAEIFHLLDPDVFVDNHVSDGADYQHVMTLLTTQHNKLGGDMGQYLDSLFEPALYGMMKAKGFDLVPYVNSFGDTPETGWPEYWDSPRYSSGYATLWQTFAFVPETHMLKPYKQRVEATRSLMECFIEFTSANSEKIKTIREQARELVKTQTVFPIAWSLDKSTYKEITFLGYEAGHKPSEVSGLPRLYYDRNKPFEKKVKIFNYYAVKNVIIRPKAYIIPQGWWKVIELLQLNKVNMRRLTHDSLVTVRAYHIDDYKTAPRQYEMHHPNSEVKISSTVKQVQFHTGDWFIPFNQVANRFLLETLEPQGEDSYFSWNFFDAILGQKEGYSGYSFEDIAADFLQKNPSARKELEDKKSTDTAFAKDGRAQLNFVYQHSPYFETNYMNYPVYRVE